MIDIALNMYDTYWTQRRNQLIAPLLLQNIPRRPELAEPHEQQNELHTVCLPMELHRGRNDMIDQDVLPNQVSNDEQVLSLAEMLTERSNRNNADHVQDEMPDLGSPSQNHEPSSCTMRSPVRISHILIVVHFGTVFLYTVIEGNPGIKLILKYIGELVFRLEIGLLPVSVLVLNDDMFAFGYNVVKSCILKFLNWQH